MCCSKSIPRPFQAILDQAKGQVAQAEGQLAQAQAQLGLTEINVKRDTPLAAARAIAQSQLDNDIQAKAQAEHRSKRLPRHSGQRSSR